MPAEEETVMKARMWFGAACALFSAMASAADYPAPKTGEWIVKDLRFHSGEVLPEARLAYTTIGDPKNEAIVVLHGTGGSAASMLTPGFAGELFGAGQPLDARATSSSSRTPSATGSRASPPTACARSSRATTTTTWWTRTIACSRSTSASSTRAW
jgi:hypothetical protein